MDDSPPPPPAPAPSDPGTTRSPYKLKPKTDFAVSNPPLPRGECSPDHDVWALRQTAADGTRPPLALGDPQALQFPDLAPQPPRPNRKRRDYWLLILSGNAVLGTITALGWGNPFIMACGVGGMGAYTLGLTWVMWGVMGRY